MLELYVEVTRIAETLDSAQIDYAICGGVAGGIHGFVRATVDIDLLVRSEDLPFVRAAMAGLTVDIQAVTPQSMHVWNSRTSVRWTEGELKIVSRDGYIALKRARAQSQDLVDIDRLPDQVDYGERAVTTRIHRVSQLRRLCFALGEAKSPSANIKRTISDS